MSKKKNHEKEQLLKHAIETYIEKGEPIGSQALVDKYDLKISSAKVRYIMNELENEGLLVKTHSSSGRMPSKKGFEHYAKFLVSKDENYIKNKMKDVFAKRWNSIDTTLEESVKHISDIAGVALVTSESNEHVLLISISLVKIDEEKATIILVDSNGEVYSKLMNLHNKSVKMDDLKIAIRIFKERLINQKIVDLPTLVQSLKDILAEQIKNFEDLIENFVTNIFNFKIIKRNHVYGKDKLILADEIERENLVKILDVMENKSIWETIEEKYQDEDETKIKISINEDNTAMISKKIDANCKFNEIALVGTSRMNYEKGLAALQKLEELIQNKN
ncbi:heat-inducible transcriptional repressor HrcA [Mycoplasmopsis iners]|uniref:heat-inducible transcriptional repressor HrcA n=1 Tax=Mycoplasmopsis iners TaxID=76630 RepID=UPI000496A99F|nr:heat-inducible transcriptional repressor HrcA [Mycoplasmopsis iners]